MDATPTRQEPAVEMGSELPGEQPRKPWTQGPLPEVVGYVGAALVASAGLNFVAQSWERWGYPVRMGIVATAALLLYAGGLTVLGTAGWRAGLRDPAKANRRRLVAVLFALAAPLVGAWIAPGVVSTLAVAGTSAWVGIATMSVYVAPWAEYWVPVAIAASGAAWLAVAPRVLSAPVLCEALGLAWILMFLGPAAVQDLASPVDVLTDAQIASIWVSRGILAVVAIVALVLFARGADWAWAVGGVIAAVLVAGVVLLAVSGLMLAMRRRSGGSHAVGGGDAT